VEEAAMTSVKCCNTPALNGMKTLRLGVSFDLDRLNLMSKLELSVDLGCQTGHRSVNTVNRNIC